MVEGVGEKVGVGWLLGFWYFSSKIVKFDFCRRLYRHSLSDRRGLESHQVLNAHQCLHAGHCLVQVARVPFSLNEALGSDFGRTLAMQVHDPTGKLHQPAGGSSRIGRHPRQVPVRDEKRARRSFRFLLEDQIAFPTESLPPG